MTKYIRYIRDKPLINPYSNLTLLPNTPLCVYESRISLLTDTKKFTFTAVQLVKLQIWDWYKQSNLYSGYSCVSTDTDGRSVPFVLAGQPSYQMEVSPPCKHSDFS